MTKYIRRTMWVKADSAPKRIKKRKSASKTTSMYGGLKIQMPSFKMPLS